MLLRIQNHSIPTQTGFQKETEGQVTSDLRAFYNRNEVVTVCVTVPCT